MASKIASLASKLNKKSIDIVYFVAFKNSAYHLKFTRSPSKAHLSLPMQKTISLSNITFSIREKHILQGVSFRCNENERVCIFGENGAGKSTLLKILCGEVAQTGGRIEKQGHIRFVYVTQEFDQAFNPKLFWMMHKQKVVPRYKDLEVLLEEMKQD